MILQSEKRKVEPSPQMIQEAKNNPGGYVYELNPKYDPNGAVPPQGIKGAWKVDEQGKITGEYVPNSNYKPH